MLDASWNRYSASALANSVLPVMCKRTIIDIKYEKTYLKKNNDDDNDDERKDIRRALIISFI